MIDLATFRRAVAPHLGAVLTPERAAGIESACRVAMPIPHEAPGVTSAQEPRFFDFVNAALSSQYHPGNSVVLAREVDGIVRAVVVFTDLRRWSVEMAVASDGSGHWLSRHLLRAAFRYPFAQLGLPRVTARVEADNDAALRMDLHLGFRHEGVQRRQFGQTDCVLLGMLRDECRWLERTPQ